MFNEDYLMNKYWDKRNTVYKNQRLAFSKELQEYIIERKISIVEYFIKLLKPKTIIDVGCGVGYISEILADKYKDKIFYLLDFSKENLKQVTIKENIIINHSECWNILYNNKSFDFLFAFDLLFHLTPFQVGKSLIEFNRVSKNFFIHYLGNEISSILDYRFLFTRLRIPSKKIINKLILFYTKRNEIPFDKLKFYRRS